jgi:hypothetical protein
MDSLAGLGIPRNGEGDRIAKAGNAGHLVLRSPQPPRKTGLCAIGAKWLKTLYKKSYKMNEGFVDKHKNLDIL